MILCQFSFATNDAMVKYVYQSYNEIFVLNQIIFLRGIFALFFIGLFCFLNPLIITNFAKCFLK